MDIRQQLATPEEKELMTDPSKVSYRIFVGSLPSECMTKLDLKQMFEPFGPVAGVVLNKRFGFVQFESESSAKDAIAAQGKVGFGGKIVDIKPARPLIRKPNAQGTETWTRDRSPITEQHFVDKGREPTRFPVHDRRPKFPPHAPVAGVERANDCEIIVVNKAQTEYAEYIEHKLRRLGLTVDLLFPNEDVPVTRVLNNIANRGCLFAIVILPQNEEHRSITINILHGPPQEHRNMPLEDAIGLVSRSFDAYMLREKTSRPPDFPVAPTAAAPAVLSLLDRHPENIQGLINLLADNRTLTVLQYDKIISYLQSKRELQLKVELGDAAPTTLPITIESGGAVIGADKHQVLQSRILNILNKSVSTTASPSQSTINMAKPPILADPTVQKTLNSLIQGDLFRKLPEAR